MRKHLNEKLDNLSTKFEPITCDACGKHIGDEQVDWYMISNTPYHLRNGKYFHMLVEYLNHEERKRKFNSFDLCSYECLLRQQEKYTKDNKEFLEIQIYNNYAK